MLEKSNRDGGIWAHLGIGVEPCQYRGRKSKGGTTAWVTLKAKNSMTCPENSKKSHIIGHKEKYKVDEVMRSNRSNLEELASLDWEKIYWYTQRSISEGFHRRDKRRERLEAQAPTREPE